MEDILKNVFALSMILLIPVMLIGLACLVVVIIAKWKIFEKSGKEGWKSIIPYYNSWVLNEIAGTEWWFFLGLIAASIVRIIGLDSLDGLATIVQLVASFFVNYNIAKKFGKETGFAVGLTLLPVIFYAILAFSKDCNYVNVSVSKYGPVAEK